MQAPFLWSAIAFVVGYLLGSIPFGLLLTRFAGTQDLRTIGSGNIGATNVLRTGRKGLAAATLIGDALKGTLAVVLAKWFGGPEAAVIAGLGAFLGHLFPVWLNFKGGKGVATYIGILIGLAWPAAVGFCIIWLAVAAVTKYSSLSALFASAMTPVYLWVTGDSITTTLFMILTILLWITHRTNIVRILNGTEGKIGAKEKVTEAAPGGSAL